MGTKIKRIFKKISLKRTTVLILVFVIMSVVLVRRLFDLQIIQGEDYISKFQARTTKERVLKSTRGNILDRNGDILASNVLSYSLTLEDNGTYTSTREKNLTLNGVAYQVLQILHSNGDDITHSFHIVVDKNGEYAFDVVEGFTLNRFRADIYGQALIDDLKDEQKTATADQMMEFLTGSEKFSIVLSGDRAYTEDELISHGLPLTLTKQEMLDIATIRYELNTNSFKKYMQVTIATNVSEKSVAAIMENKTGLHYLAEFGGVEGELKLMLTPSAVHRESVFGRPVRIGKTLTLTNESYGWKVENSHYVMYILRSNGVIRELYAKVDGHLVPVLRKQNLTAAKTMFSGMPYAAASMDPETTVRLVRENGVLRMKFTGEIRSAYAVGKDRLRLVTEYVFDDSPQVGCEFTFRPSGARPGKPELVFSAERERFPKYLRWNMASSAGAGAVADVSRGRKLKFRFFDGIRNPLPPRTDYRIALSFRTDGKPCPRPRVPETAAPVILRADSGFEERCALVSEKDGRRILNLRSEYDETLPWFICFAAYAAPGIGRGGSAGIYMSWPNPVFMQEVNPGRLEQGRFRFSFDLKGTLLREPSVKAWSDRMITVHPFLKEYTPLSAHVDYYAENGVKKTLSRSWKLGKIYDWKTFEMTVDIPENAYAPSVRIEAMPEYAGVLFLDNISFEKVE